MGAFDDVESSRPRSPALNMLGRGVGDARRKVVLLILLAGVLIISFTAFRRHDQIKDIISDQRQSWSTDVPAKPGIAKPDIASHKPAEPSTEEKGSRLSPPIVEKPSHSQEKTKKPVSGKGDVATGPSIGDRSLSAASLMDVRNESLGFSQVYVLNVPGRTDKSDAMRLTASLTGFNFEIIDGVSGKDVPEKALSGSFDEHDGKWGVIGCWRGHMNFAHTIIKNRLSSAMIMEDDADWDVNFRSQLELVALGSQTLLDTPKTSEPHSPYGDGWDLIWLGHCASQPVDGDYRRFLMKNDPTVTPPEHRVNYGGVPDMSKYGDSTRMMYFTKGSTCTYAYALSFHGAQKVLKWLSMDVYNKPVDFGLHDMCSEKERGFKCLGVFPQIVGDHKPPGGANKDSDIGDSEASKVRTTGFSYNIVHSTRLNVDLLIDGKKNEVTSQWPEDTPKLTGPVEVEIRQDPVDDTPD